MIKYFRFTWDYVMWELTYANLMMLLATIPVYEPKTDTDELQLEKEKKEEGLEVESLQDLSSFLNIPKKKK